MAGRARESFKGSPMLLLLTWTRGMGMDTRHGPQDEEGQQSEKEDWGHAYTIKRVTETRKFKTARLLSVSSGYDRGPSGESTRVWRSQGPQLYLPHATPASWGGLSYPA